MVPPSTKTFTGPSDVSKVESVPWLGSGNVPWPFRNARGAAPVRFLKKSAKAEGLSNPSDCAMSSVERSEVLSAFAASCILSRFKYSAGDMPSRARKIWSSRCRVSPSRESASDACFLSARFSRIAAFARSVTSRSGR